eukprot:1153050-Pelagomonas_calceolata.AAC.15
MVGGKPGVVGDELERELFVLRKAVEAERDAKLPAEKASDFYTCSLSNKTIIYKASAPHRNYSGDSLTVWTLWHAMLHGHAALRGCRPVLPRSREPGVRDLLCHLPPPLLHQHHPQSELGTSCAEPAKERTSHCEESTSGASPVN